MDPKEMKERMKIPKQPMPEQEPKERLTNFYEVPYGYTAELAIAEAKRCIQCKNPVCEAYQKDLQGMDLQDMVCGEKDDTDNIKRPKWERLDLRENKELLKKVHKFVRVGDQFGELKIMDDEKEFDEVLNKNLILASLI